MLYFNGLKKSAFCELCECDYSIQKDKLGDMESFDETVLLDKEAKLMYKPIDKLMHSETNCQTALLTNQIDPILKLTIYWNKNFM